MQVVRSFHTVMTVCDQLMSQLYPSPCIAWSILRFILCVVCRRAIHASVHRLYIRHLIGETMWCNVLVRGRKSVNAINLLFAMFHKGMLVLGCRAVHRSKWVVHPPRLRSPMVSEPKVPCLVWASRLRTHLACPCRWCLCRLQPERTAFSPSRVCTWTSIIACCVGDQKIHAHKVLLHVSDLCFYVFVQFDVLEV